MSKVLKILKINFLSLLALPPFFISILSQLLIKALEKALVFLGVGAALFALFLLNLIFNNPDGFLDGLGTLVAMLILFGGIILIVGGILFLAATVGAFVLTAVVSLFNTILGFVFNSCHNLYSRLFALCKQEYSALSDRSQIKASALSCPFFYLLKGLNAALIFLLSAAAPLAVLSSLLFIGYSVYSAYQSIHQTFGIGIFSYLELFPTINMVFAILYFVVVNLGVIAVILSLGLEWAEWGRLLKFSTQNYEEYREALLQQSMELSASDPSGQIAGDGEALKKCQEAMAQLQELLDEVEFLQQQVDAAMHIKPDPALSYELAEYISLLEKLTSGLSSYKKEIPCSDFEAQFLPMIKRAQKLSHALTGKLLAILVSRPGQNAPSALDFFGGCQTEDDLKRRYRALSKVYHPDAGGHGDTFTVLQEQYERRLAELNAAK